MLVARGVELGRIAGGVFGFGVGAVLHEEFRQVGWLAAAARCSAVVLPSAPALTSAPMVMRSSVSARLPARTAAWMGVMPTRSRASRLAPRPMRSRLVFWRAWKAAVWSGVRPRTSAALTSAPPSSNFFDLGQIALHGGDGEGGWAGRAAAWGDDAAGGVIGSRGLAVAGGGPRIRARAAAAAGRR